MGAFARGKHRLCLALATGLAAGPLFAQSPAEGRCPQPRFTGKAPDEYYNRPNALEATPANVAAGEAIYQGDGRKVSCISCHGPTGDGNGRLAYQFDPRPRDFACADTIKGIPDGHLFWIVRFGSPGTSMPPHKRLTDEQIWQVVHFVRTLAR